MKILCLIDSLSLGGAERQMIGLVALLRERGFQTNLVTYYKENYYSDLTKKYGITYSVLKGGNRKLSKLIAVKKYIEETGGYDCLIAYKGGPCIIGCLLKLLGTKFKLIVSERSSTVTMDYVTRIKFFLYKWADYIVPNSYTEADNLKKRFKSLSKKIIPITNFTDTEYFKAIDTQTNKNLIILTMARITKAKNIINYLRAIKSLKERGVKNIHFDWYGSVQQGDEEYAELCFNERITLNIEDIFTFHPAVKDVLPYYQKCDIFCLPSIYEGFPNVICEAMSCGKPIVCSNVCDMPYLVKDGKNGYLFDPKDINDIADKLHKMCCLNLTERKRYGDQGRIMGMSLYAESSFVNKYIQLIQNS